MPVSVIVPCYNAAETLADTLESVQMQTDPEWEAIIVNDGSTDASLAIAEAMARGDPRFRIVSQANRGLCGARNTGLRHATSDWLLFIDADDFISAAYLERMTERLRLRPQLDGVVCRWARAYPDGQVSGQDRCWISLDNFFPESLLGCPFALTAACVVGKRAVEAVGGFDEEIATCGDWHLWQKLSRAGAKFDEVAETLAFYRMRPSAMSRDAAWQFREAIKIIEIGLGRDPAVRCPLPQFEHGAEPRYGDIGKAYALAYWGGMVIRQGGRAEDLMQEVGRPFPLRVPPLQIAECLLIGIQYAACKLEMDWFDEWRRLEPPIMRFLQNLEHFTDSPGLAEDTARQIRSALRRRGADIAAGIEGAR